MEKTEKKNWIFIIVSAALALVLAVSAVLFFAMQGRVSVKDGLRQNSRIYIKNVRCENNGRFLALYIIVYQELYAWKEEDKNYFSALSRCS